MIRPGKTFISVALGAAVLLSAGLAIALEQDKGDHINEKRLTQACERSIIKKTPQGQRDMTILSYEQESAHVGIVKGGLKTRLYGHRWSQVHWSCRIDPGSARVLRAEFGWPGNGSRLLAAASHLQR